MMPSIFKKQVAVCFCVVATLCEVSFAALPLPDYCAKHVAENTISPINSLEIASEYGNLTLLQVQILIRHGARAPCNSADCWKGYNTTWKCGIRDYEFPEFETTDSKKLISHRLFKKIFQNDMNILRGNCQLGQLLDEGYDMEATNGRIFRDAYVGNAYNNLFDQNESIDFTNPADFFLESSNYQRTVMSGQIVMDAMFPADSAMPTIIPWYTQDMDRSYILANSKVCPRLEKIEKSWRTSDTFLQWNSSDSNKQLDNDLTQALETFSSSNLFDCIMTSWCSGKDVPPSLTPDLMNRVIQRKYEQESMLLNNNNSEYAKAAISILTKKIRHRMLARASSAVPSADGPRFVLYSGHDSTLMPFLAAFGKSSWNGEFVPYASHIVIELYATQKGVNLVRVLFQGKPVKVQGCRDDGICELNAFMDATLYGEDGSLCQSEVSADLDLTNVQAVVEAPRAGRNWATFFVALILGCGIGAGLTYVFLKKENSMQQYQKVDRNDNDKTLEEGSEAPIRIREVPVEDYRATSPKQKAPSMDNVDEDFDLFGSTPSKA